MNYCIVLRRNNRPNDDHVRHKKNTGVAGSSTRGLHMCCSIASLPLQHRLYHTLDLDRFQVTQVHFEQHASGHDIHHGTTGLSVFHIGPSATSKYTNRYTFSNEQTMGGSDSSPLSAFSMFSHWSHDLILKACIAGGEGVVGTFFINQWDHQNRVLLSQETKC